MSKKVLYIDSPGFKPLPGACALRIAAHSAEIFCVTDGTAANTILDKSGQYIDIVVTNSPSKDIFEKIRTIHPSCKIILCTSETMEGYSKILEGQEHKLIDFVIANRSPNPWTINELRITIQKLLRNEIFGIEKYLIPGTIVEKIEVTGSGDRELLNTKAMEFAERNKLGSYMSKLIFGISEELLMNAIYDAPIAAGHAHYAELPRTTPIILKPQEFSRLSYGFDGQVFAIGVRDPFGAFKREKLFEYLKKVVNRRDSAKLIDTKKGGAGLGLFKILYSSHALVCNVKPEQSTEVIALIDTQEQVRDFSKMARSVTYFKAS